MFSVNISVSLGFFLLLMRLIGPGHIYHLYPGALLLQTQVPIPLGGNMLWGVIYNVDLRK